MNIILEFDYYSKIMYIPDGYINDLKEVYLNFFEWLYDESDCYTESMLGVNYDEQDFIRYINEVILIESREKAYIVQEDKKIIKRKMMRLKF